MGWRASAGNPEFFNLPPTRNNPFPSIKGAKGSNRLEGPTVTPLFNALYSSENAIFRIALRMAFSAVPISLGETKSVGPGGRCLLENLKT